MRRLRLLPLAASLLLAACAETPSRHASPVIPKAPKTAIVSVETSPPPPAAALEPVAEVEPWDELRNSFEMPGCDADPAILARAKLITRHPGKFEEKMQQSLPRLEYVRQVAKQYDVAGEFVLLPWIESHFQPAHAGSMRRPAGMWQIMPVTARAMGLRINKDYDGRLDIPEATKAIMKLLEQYQEQFHDWRVVDYAYNAGEFSIRKIIRTHGMPAQTPALPAWPVRQVTREHLIKLLGIACVIREPERFQVNLPSLPAGQKLVRVEIPHDMPVQRAATHAGMSPEIFKKINSSLRSDTINADVTSYLMLPASHAQQFREALLSSPAGMTARISDTNSDASHTDSSKAAEQPTHQTHTVSRGESLWKIAHQYSVSIPMLIQWNHLSGHKIKPGQVLQIN